MIYSIFKDKVSRYPHNIAFVLESEQHQFTYQEADILIDKIAHYLYGIGVRQGQRVGFMTTYGSLHPFIFYALDKLNATYVPLDIEVPEKQLACDLNKLKLSHFIGDENLNLSPEIKGTMHLIQQKEFLKGFENDDDQTNHFPEIKYNSDIPVYIVSSSGSSGAKKWMEVGGAGLGYWEKTEEAQFHFQPEHRVLGKCSDAYDASISEKLRALIAGGTLHMISLTERKDIDFIIEYCEKYRITELLLIASQLKGDDLERKIERLAKAGLKYLYVTGDACNPILQGLCEKHGIILINAYGSSEETFGISTQPVNGLRLTDDKGKQIVPIGLPYGQEIKIHIIDERLYVESPYLIKEYIDDPIKTALAFQTIKIDDKDVRIFDSGDRFVEHVVEGQKFLEFKGRFSTNNESKVVGVKVDSHDIEQLIKQYSGQDENLVDVCVVSKKIDGNTKLVAYLVTKQTFNTHAFLAYLKGWLKAEEIPLLISMDVLPIMAVNGKIHINALKERIDKPEEYLLSKATANHSYQNQFNNQTTQALEKIWETVLKVKPQTHDDNFVLWGGDSIGCKRMHALISKGIDPKFLYRHLMSLEVISINNIYLKLTGHIKENTTPMALIHPLNQPRETSKKNVFILPHILGEGDRSFQYLAKHYMRGHDVNMVGLSDPGIYDASMLPETLDDAVNRYVAAILKTQPTGPYQLMGFSYGCLLAYHTAVKLQSLGHQVSNLFLIDGFPSGFYHQLSLQQHADLINDFSKNIVEILNAEYYDEKVVCKKLPELNKLEKNAQVNLAIDSLLSQVHNDLSRCMLQLAKRHLLFMLSDTQKVKISIPKVKFYVSRPDQHYHTFIDSIPGLNKNSTDYLFYYWNHYINSMQRSGDVAKSDHLSLIKEERGAQVFFQYGHDPLKEFNVFVLGSFTERVAYLSLNKANDYCLTICNIIQSSKDKMLKEFQDNDLCDSIECIPQSDKLNIARKPNDIIFESHYAIVVKLSKKHWPKIKAYCAERNIDIVQLPRKCSVIDRANLAMQNNPEPMDISIDFVWNRSLFMRFYFHATSNSAEVMNALANSEYASEIRPKYTHGQLTLAVNFTHFGSVFEAMRAVERRMKTILPELVPYVLAQSKAQSNPEKYNPLPYSAR